MLTARALYSNVSESPDELSFNQGDVLAVLQKDVNGLSGWWLCLVDGRLGLAPGNRLKVTARRVEPHHDDMRPLESELRSADDSKWTHVVKGLQQSDSNDSRQIYDVPPKKNSSSTFPQNISEKSHEIVYDVPPSSNAANHDKARKVEFAGETEYQDPRLTRNQSQFSDKTTPGRAALRQLRTVPSRETTTTETLPESSGKDLSEDAGDGGRMGSVVRVCVEDDDDLTSEDTVVASTRTPLRGLNDDFRTGQGNRTAPSSSSKYHNASGATGRAAEETGRFSSTKRLAFCDPRSTGKAATLPRKIAGGTGQRSDDLGIVTNCDYADQKPYRQSPVVQLSSSISSEPSCTVGHLKAYDERESFTDNYYSVPTKWKSLPSPRFRRSSGSVDRPLPPPPKDAVGTRRTRSEARPTGDHASCDQEYQLSFVDTGIFVDCPPDPRSVSQTMESLQQTVRRRTGMIRDLCLGLDVSAGGDERKKEADTAQMKECCVSLRTALREFADLGTGVLANAMQSPSRDMSENILGQLETLQVFSQDLSDSVDSVVSASRGERVRRGGANLRDALNTLLAITRDIVQPLDSLAYLVAKNSAVIFSAGKALPPPNPVPGFPAIMDIRSPSSPSLPALPGTAREFKFNFLPPNNITTQALSPYSIVEMLPGSPNVLYIQNSSPGNLVDGRVARDGKTGAMIAVQSPGAIFHSFPDYHTSSPTPTLQTPPLNFQSAASSALPCYFQTSNLPMVGTEPERPGPRRYFQTRPLLQLPCEEEAPIANRSNDNTVDWKSVENEYSLIADEAERDMKRNVGVLVGRLIERSGAGAGSSQSLLRSNGSSSWTSPTNLGVLSPRQTERLKTTSRPTSDDEQTGYVSKILTSIDREIVQFYMEEVRGHCDDVTFVADDLLVALVDGSTTGTDLFVTLSRRVVLAAHKLMFAGDAIAKKFASDEELRSHVASIANDLGVSLKGTLVASKAGGCRAVGNNFRCQEMIDCMNQVKFLSVKLRDLISAYVFDRIE